MMIPGVGLLHLAVEEVSSSLCFLYNFPPLSLCLFLGGGLMHTPDC